MPWRSDKLQPSSLTAPVRKQRSTAGRGQGQVGQQPRAGKQDGDSHAISLLSIPLPPPLARGLAVSLQSLLVNLLPLLFPAQVLGPLPAGHGQRHVTSTAWASPAALPKPHAVRACSCSFPSPLNSEVGPVVQGSKTAVQQVSSSPMVTLLGSSGGNICCHLASNQIFTWLAPITVNSSGPMFCLITQPST